MPKVSIVIPIYNTELYLRECLDSVINQTLTDIEIICVDDGSTDGSADICWEYAAADSRIRVITQKNSGAAAARKAGVMAASGEYLGFVDSDDWIEPDMYETLLNQIGTCDIITSDADMWYDNLPPGVYETSEEMRYVRENMLIIGDTLTRGISGPMWNKLFRMDLAKDLFEEIDISVYLSEDLIFTCCYILRCKSVCISGLKKYHYRERPGSIWASSYDGFLQNYSNLYLNLKTMFQGQPDSTRLVEQLHLYMMLVLPSAPYRMAFSPKAQFLRYVNPFSNDLAGKRVALYGAGTVGQNYYLHMMRTAYCTLTIWVDTQYDRYVDVFPVRPVEELAGVEYDYLLIAVNREDVAQEIQSDLVARGVDFEKILWKKPICMQ